MVNKEGSKKGYVERLVCSLETKKLVTTDCVNEFLEHHPDFKGMNITNNFILNKIVEYYLKND